MESLNSDIINTFLNSNPVYQDILEFRNSNHHITDTPTDFLNRIGTSNILLWYNLNFGTPDTVTQDELSDYLNFLDEYSYPMFQYFLVLLYYPINSAKIVNPEIRDKINQFQKHFKFNTNNDILISAAKHGYLDIVKYAIKNGANIHINDDLVLRWSARSGYLDIVKYLVSQGADIHAMDDEPLRLSASKGYLDIVQYLVSQGADIHAMNDESLRISATKGYSDIVEYLISQGADVNVLTNPEFKPSSRV